MINFDANLHFEQWNDADDIIFINIKKKNSADACNTVDKTCLFCNEVKVQKFTIDINLGYLTDVSITDCGNKGSALSPFPDYSFYVSGVFFFLLLYFV